MSSFDFKVSPKSKHIGKLNLRPAPNIKPKVDKDLIAKNVIGVVNIDIDGNYYVVCGNKPYDFDKDSISTKGLTTVYKTGLHKGHIERIERDGEFLHEMHPLMFKPFQVSHVVLGDIRRNKKGEEVYFYKELSNKNVNGCREALQFYKDNYDEIRSKVIKRLYDGV